MNDPIKQFEAWYEAMLAQSDTDIPSACCLSTHGLDGYPNARFVSLKAIREGKFLIAGPMHARKGQEMKLHPKAALTFWWAEAGQQVRVQGDVTFVEEQEAKALFEARSRDSRIVSLIANQGETIQATEALETAFLAKKESLENDPIPLPTGWGAVLIDPVRIEFLTFRENRLHVRELFEKEVEWSKSILAP